MIKQNSNEQGGHTRGRQSSGVAAQEKSRLSDAALLLLGAGAGRADGLLLPPPASCRARGKALQRVLGSLLKAGLVYEVPVMADEQAWRKGEAGARVGLAITDAGRRAIGVPAAEGLGSTVAGQPAKKGRRSKKPDNAAEPQAAAVSSPALEQAESVRPQPTSASPGQPRQTKQARLVNLLSGPKGQSVAVLGEAFGWLPHTVRAALTGLRQKGFVLTKSKDETGTTLYRAEPDVGARGPSKAA